MVAVNVVKCARGETAEAHKAKDEDFSSVAVYATTPGNTWKSRASVLLWDAVKSEREQANNRAYRGGP